MFFIVVGFCCTFKKCWMTFSTVYTVCIWFYKKKIIIPKEKCCKVAFNLMSPPLWKYVHILKRIFTHPTRSGGRTAGSRSVVWWCWGWGRRLRCKILRTASRERAPGQSSPPSTPGGPASVRPARTLGGALPSCSAGKITHLRFCAFLLLQAWTYRCVPVATSCDF